MTASEIFKKIDKVAKKEKVGVFVVGGFVRDFLIGREQTKDIDFVVVGSGLEFAKKFDEEFKKESLTGIAEGDAGASLVEFSEFDTARYVIGEGDEQIILEFAGARNESYRANSRKPIVAAATLEDDLKRRDFTVNAMAVAVSAFIKLSSPLSSRAKPRDPLTLTLADKLTLRPAASVGMTMVAAIKKNIVDPFGGQKDLADKILRTPLAPDETFSDDPLRMMRAIRFAGQLEFGIEPKTLKAIFENRERIKIISAERVQEELLKMLAVRQPSICLALMFQTRLLDLVLPEVAALDGVEEIYGHLHKNILTHTLKVVDNIAERSDKINLRLAGLFHDIGKPGTKKFVRGTGWTFYQHDHLGKKLVHSLGRRLRFSTDLTKYLAKLVRWHMQPIALMDNGITDSAVRRLVVSLGEELEDLLILGVSDITTGNPIKLKKRQENYTRLRAKIDEVFEKDKLRAFQSPFRGDEIMKACGLKPGPTVGKIKDAIEEAILDGIIPNEHEAAAGYFEKIKEEYIKNAQGWERI